MMHTHTVILRMWVVSMLSWSVPIWMPDHVLWTPFSQNEHVCSCCLKLIQGSSCDAYQISAWFSRHGFLPVFKRWCFHEFPRTSFLTPAHRFVIQHQNSHLATPYGLCDMIAPGTEASEWHNTMNTIVVLYEAPFPCICFKVYSITEDGPTCLVRALRNGAVCFFGTGNGVPKEGQSLQQKKRHKGWVEHRFTGQAKVASNSRGTFTRYIS